MPAGLFKRSATIVGAEHTEIFEKLRPLRQPEIAFPRLVTRIFSSRYFGLFCSKIFTSIEKELTEDFLIPNSQRVMEQRAHLN